MKIAVLIQCHKAPEQINMLLDAMKHPNIDFFIHVDAKSNISNQITKRDDIYLLPDALRVDVQWAKISQVRATLNLIKYATEIGCYDYFCLISGQDFPIVSADNIVAYLTTNNGKNFVDLFASKNNGIGKPNNYDKRNDIVFPGWLMERKSSIRILRRLWVMLTGGYNHTFKMYQRKHPANIKFYFGSQWWCIHKDFVAWMFEYLRENSIFETFYSLCSCADESFFQTLLMNSPYLNTREEYLHYIDWSEGKSSPKNLGVQDFDNITKSGKLFARKIDNNYELLKLMIKYHQEQ